MKSHTNSINELPIIDGEVWVDVDGWNGYYKVSNMGRVFTVSRYVNHAKYGVYWRKGRLLSQKNKRGYKEVRLQLDKYSKHVHVHRLVLIHFVGEPPIGKDSINHINGIKDDNRVENLEWCSVKENIHHAREFLNAYHGEANGMAIANEEVVADIRSGYKRKKHGYLIQMSEKHGLSVRQVGKICRGEAWSHIPIIKHN